MPKTVRVHNGSQKKYWYLRGFPLGITKQTRVFDGMQSNESLPIIWDTWNPQERQIVLLVCKGWNNTDIADQLNVSVKLVERVLSQLYRRHALQNRAHLAAHTAARLCALEALDLIRENPTGNQGDTYLTYVN